MSTNEMDQRQRARKPSFYSARIDTGKGAPKIRCEVTELSTVGAKLNIQSPQILPESFTLVLPDASSHSCRVIWRSDEQVGVKFLP